MDASQQVEKKLGMSLDELIAQQRTKQAKRTTKKAPSVKSKTLVRFQGPRLQRPGVHEPPGGRRRRHRPLAEPLHFRSFCTS